MAEFSLRGHHVSLLAIYWYTREAKDADTKELFDNILKNTLAEVEIIGSDKKSLDSICALCSLPPRIKEGCNFEDTEDWWTREAYDLEIGKKVSVEELIKKIEYFRQDTGVTSFREYSIQNNGRYASRKRSFLPGSNEFFK